MPPLSPRNITDGYVSNIQNTVEHVPMEDKSQYCVEYSLSGECNWFCKPNMQRQRLMPEESLIITGSYYLHVISGEVEILGDFLVW